jgi:hypothetical protein
MKGLEQAQIPFIRSDDLESAKAYIEALEDQCRALAEMFADSIGVKDEFSDLIQRMNEPDRKQQRQNAPPRQYLYDRQRSLLRSRMTAVAVP